jgi:methyl-accepting chemotaxis protein
MLLRTKILTVTALVVAVPLGAISFAVYSKQRFVADIDNLSTITIAIRNHTLADMVHDGLRSDVYSALMAKEIGRSKQQVETDLAEKAKVFETAVGENKALPLSADVLAAINGVEAPLNDYVATARKVVGLALTDRPAALLAVPEFDKKFDALETSMEAAGARIEAASLQMKQQAESFSAMATLASWLSLAAFLVSSAILLFFNLLGLLRPLARIEGSMHALAGEKLDFEIPYLKQKDEIGAMAGALEVFRQTALQRDGLRREQETARESGARNWANWQMPLIVMFPPSSML